MSTARTLLIIGIPALILGALTIPRADAGGWGGHGHRGHGDVSVEDARDHADVMADRLIKKVDGTDAQRDAIDGVLDEVVPTMLDMKDDKTNLRKRAHESLSTGELDRAELESIRVDMLGLVDDASATMLDAFVRVGEILDAEQRQVIVAELERRHR